MTCVWQVCTWTHTLNPPYMEPKTKSLIMHFGLSLFSHLQCFCILIFYLIISVAKYGWVHLCRKGTWRYRITKIYIYLTQACIFTFEAGQESSWIQYRWMIGFLNVIYSDQLGIIYITQLFTQTHTSLVQRVLFSTFSWFFEANYKW